MPKKNAGFKLEIRKETGNWEIVWFEGGRRKRRSTGTANRIRATQLFAEFVRTEKHRKISRLIGDVLTDYQNEHIPFVIAPERIAYSIIWLSPFFGNLEVEQITNAKCKEYAAQRRASDGTIRRELSTLRAALNHDKAENRIDYVPSIWMPESARPKDRWLTRKEVANLLRRSRKVSDYLQWFIVISLYTGQRKQAVLNLTWDRINLVNGTIDWQYGKETKKRRIIQPMPDEIRMFLGYLSKYGTNGYVLNIRGRKIADIRSSLRSALKLSGLSDVTPHTLKHTAVTWMLQNGTDIWAIAGFTGTSVKTLENTYGHHSPEYMEDARTSFKKARKRRLN